MSPPAPFSEGSQPSTSASAPAAGGESPSLAPAAPSRRTWLGWLTVFILFFAVPLGILYEGYRIYSTSQSADAQDRLIQYYTRELTSLRNHVSNDRVLRQMFHSFRDSYVRSYTKPGKLPSLIANTLKELPATSTLILWDASGTIKIEGAPFPGGEALINLLRKGHARYAEGNNLQTSEAGEAFAKEAAPIVKSLEPILGKDFPLQALVLAPGTLIMGDDPANPCVLYWDLLKDQGTPLGGFLAVLPGRSIPETFGLAYVLPSDQAANPEFSNGFASMEDPTLFQAAFPGLEPLAKRFFNQYRLTLESPIIDKDWVFVVIPFSESSTVRLFSIFSIRRFRLDLETSTWHGLLLTLFLLAGGGMLFWQAYQRAHSTGLSIKIKLAGLFLLSMMLPLSLLVLLGLHYSLDRTKILTSEAGQRLARELKRLDDNIVEFHRLRTIQWQGLKDLPEVKALDRGQLSATGKALREKKLLERLYIVDASGTVLFDQDHLFGDPSRKAFAGELGRRALELAGLGRRSGIDLNAKDVLTRGFANRLAGQRGQLQQAIWPGTTTKVYLFVDLVHVDGPDGRPTKNQRALIVTMDKTALDREYLAEAIRNQVRRDPDLHFLALNRDDLTDTIPELRAVFKANLLPLISTVQIRDFSEAERVPDEDRSLLVALSQGRLIEDYLLGAHLDYNQVMESIDRMYSFIGIALILSILGSLTLVAILGRNFIHPISTLSFGTRAIASGDLTKTLPVEEKDELGELSQAFNNMTTRLRNRLTELTVLYHLTQKASTSHNQREVFDLAARHLKDHLGAFDCGTAWINEGEGKENLYLAENREAMLAGTIRKTVYEAIKKRHLHFGPFPTKDPGGVLGIPLFFEEKEFGGIYLLFRQSLSKGPQLNLTPDERSFIETLRHHLSLIIEKQRLFEQAITDGLTRLYVRRFFLATLEKELARARRYKTELCLLLLDIDHFKKFNDTYGHQVGDLVLRETAQRIIECIRAVDYPGRYGGEEMAVILPQTSLQDGLLVAERIRACVESAAYTHNDLRLSVTVSIGVTSVCGRHPTVEAFVEEVDKALYRAKAEGRNRVVMAEGLSVSAPTATPGPASPAEAYTPDGKLLAPPPTPPRKPPA
ncbi:MAG: diguanylate cyclase/phosphodiesterase (GGDEF & EAL domains) with PAS/PAC sensor(s) [Candidatus Ozemobacter sibiricus]|uniref:Diguanylate cyclase/phosphodiesterase (GGDEF & EAL domains) with PAS/PAC sensor(S) n=1 Tax=Candidatus Ozemobacter sibiricus TaxID=2268124 RepID=A0A367ZUJ0_9BACT|nr:MAG: diguanylate cyclase/phosphodiesterase (GGDEF & EAL domains) with PAS/PAC sensor(s) [Candidatus Ozemobacter sibiricus]